ncbi:MAG TPA: thioesterase family protein [Gemmatimonadaceae bacterium]|jgi:acyl-CoA thioester hydrolase|nr:thioesterase family protein [Gemmatimonadaceae bacterium]
MRHVSELRVRYVETDQMGVAHHTNYLVWCEVGRTDFIGQLGMSYAQVEEQGIMLAVVEAHLKYKRSARYDDQVRVTTTVAEVRSRFVMFTYDISLANGTHLASASTALVAVGPDGKSTVIPTTLRQALEGTIED